MNPDGAAAEFHPEAFKGKAETPGWEILEDCCPFNLWHINEKDEIEWDRERCATCLGCFGVMASRGILDIPPVNFDAVDVAIADAALAVEKTVGRDKVGYINMAIDISPACDCTGHAGVPIVPNVGVFASTDAVAIDMACVEAIHRSGRTGRCVAVDLSPLQD